MFGSGSAVWVDVLPGMGKFTPEFVRQASAAGATAGAAAAKSFDSGMAAESKGSAVKRVLGGFASAAADATKVVAGGVGAIGLAIGGLSAKKGLDRLLDIDTAQSKLTGLGHSVEGIATIMDSALASVRGTAFGLGDAATVAASAVAAGIKPGQELTKYLSLTADAATIAGTSLGEMGSIINKTTSTGKVYTDNLNQLADRGIPIFQWLQTEYGVTAEGLSKMVQAGEVDSATFRRVIEENIGGAALASGKSVRGSLANVGAAFGRFGAMFLKGGVSVAPVLFTSIMNAVDRAGAALAPFADSLNTKVVAGLTAVAGWIDRVDFQRIVDGAKGLYDLVIGGDFTGALTTAFGWQEDGRAVDYLLTMRDALTGIYALVVQGDFTGAFARAFNVEEDSPVVDVILTIRDALGQVFSSLAKGDMSGVQTGFTQLAAAGGPLGDVLGQVSSGFGGILAAAGELFASALPLLPALIGSISDIVGFLADHTELITPLILALAAGFVIYRQSQVAANAAAVAGLPIRIAATAADVARTIALNNSTKATLLQMGIERSSIATRVAATGSITAATVAVSGYSIASRIAGIASTVFSVGLRAVGVAVRFALGPVGLIITAIGLLVAGVIWAYNNVGWFRDGVNAAFAGIMTAIHWLGDAAVWLWDNALKPAWDAIAAGATWLYENAIRPAFDAIGTVVGFVVDLVVGYVNVWLSIFTAIGTAAVWLWRTILEPAFSGIAAVVTFAWAVISAVFDLLVHVLVFVVGAAFTWLWESIISPVFTWIADLVSAWWTTTVANFTAVVTFVRDVLGAIFTWLWVTVISPVFTWISDKVGMAALGWQIILGTARDFIANTLAPVFVWLWQTIIKPAFDGISSVISWVWTNGIKPVFDALSGFVMKDLPDAFTTGRDAIGKAWDGLKALAKEPIRFVVDTIINDGLIGNFNKVADFFGSKKIPEIKLPEGFRSGGILPGSSRMSMGDDQLVPMRRGEGVLVSEGLRTTADRQAFLAANAAGRRGIGFASLMGGGYAEGGIVGGAIDWVRDTAGAVGQFLSDPAGAMGRVVDGLVSQIPGAEGLASMAKGAVTQLVDQAVTAIRNLGVSAMSSGGGPNGNLPAGMLAKVANFVGGPGVGPMGGMLRVDAAAALKRAEAARGSSLPLTEGYRSYADQVMRWNAFQNGTGNLAAKPGTSNHGNGLAGDFATAAQGWLRVNGPKFGWMPTGLGFSQREPWHFDYQPGKAVEPTLYDEGGVLPGGVSVIANRTRKPEYALPEGRLVDVVRKATKADASEQPLIGQLNIESSGDLRHDLDEVDHYLTVKKKGGRK